MNRAAAIVNLAVSGYYLYNLFSHTVHPGDNTGYTRMLMFACIATIPLVFLLVMVGGNERWPALIAQARGLARGGLGSWLLLAGLAVLLILMPLGMLVGVWFGMGLRFGSLFILFFVPLLLRLALAPAQEAIAAAITRTLLYFAAFFIGIGIVFFLERFGPGTEPHARHLQAIWPGYGDAAKMFFAVCVFALLNQLLEFRHALLALLARGR